MNDKELWELMSIICEGQDSEQRREVEQYITDLQKENERLNNIIEEIREYTKHKIVECYDEGSTIGEFYKICDIDSKIEDLLHKGSE